MTYPEKTTARFVSGSEDASAERSDEPMVRGCPICNARFSRDARFCPFDGERLQNVGLWDPTTDPLIGATIDGRYEVLRMLGEGGMGTVYEVRHRRLERAFALKVLRSDLAGESELSARFTREAKAAAAVSHPNVVQITDFGALPGGEPYFVMELLTGESLSEIVRRGPLSLPLAVQILRQVAAGMNAAHDVGIIHRDLKPDNILVCGPPGREVVKVLDFGLAKVAGQSRLTKRGMVFGTPHYMSPEQASGELLDPRSDIYSYGVVAYECFTGTVPFEADTFMGVMTQHMYVDPVPPRQVLGVTEQLGALEEITLRCLEKKPSARYPSMRHVLEALDQALGGEAEGRITVKPASERPSRVQPRRMELASRPTVSVAAVRRSRQRWAWALGWGAAASVVIGTGLAVWSAARGADRERDRAPQQAPSPVLVSPVAPRIGERGAERKADRPKAAPRRVTGVGAGATTPEAAREGERLAPSMREAEGRQPVAATGSSPTAPRASTSPPPRKSNDKTSQSVIGGEIVDPWLP